MIRKTVALVAAALILLGAMSGCVGKRSAGAHDELVVAGSTTILPIAEIAAEKFKEKTGTKVLVSGLGSSAGIEAVSAGTADIGTSSRDLKDEEAKLGLVDTPIAYDGIAVIVNPSNPVENLTMDQLRGIFDGQITNWKEVGGPDMAIQRVNRDEASGTREAFKKIVMGDQKFDKHAAVLPGTGQVRDVVARSEGAIGYISLGFVEPRFTNTRVKALQVDDIAATESTVADGTYPISRALHFFTKGQPTGLVKEYVDFVLSPDIQEKVVVDAGFIPANRGGAK